MYAYKGYDSAANRALLRRYGYVDCISARGQRRCCQSGRWGFECSEFNTHRSDRFGSGVQSSERGQPNTHRSDRFGSGRDPCHNRHHRATSKASIAEGVAPPSG